MRIHQIFKQFFSLFLQNRHTKHNFISANRLHHGSRIAQTKQLSAPFMQKILHMSSMENAALLETMASDLAGLTKEEAARRLKKYGLNEAAHEKPLAWWLYLWQCYKNPFNLLLTVLATISFMTEDIRAAIVIGSMVVISTAIRFVQEMRSNRAAEHLKALVSNTATVIRRTGTDDNPKLSMQTDIPMHQLVPGDIIVLSAGDMIPADCRLLNAKDLFVSQAAMTGESLPVEKFALVNTTLTPLFDTQNVVFMGTNVISGTATAIVLSTGNHTYFGSLAARVTAHDGKTTAFQMGVNSVSWLLIRFALVMVPVVLLINGFTKGDWVEACLFALSIAVGLTPEMLPMIVTSTLAKGAVVLSRQKVIVKHLDAIQNFGAMDVLCTDKTGTLTQDKIVLERHTDAFGTPSDHVLHYAYLNSYYQTGLKNLLDHAVLRHDDANKKAWVSKHYHKVDEIPFDFNRRRMSVVVEKDKQHAFICKGAVEEMLSICSHISVETEKGLQHVPLTQELLMRVKHTAQELNQQGLRVVAVAVKTQSAKQLSYTIADESDLTLVGYIAFLDPPKESAEKALRALAEHGVNVKVLTGDSALIAAHVCMRIGLDSSHVLTGSEIEAFSDDELKTAVETHQIFAHLTPHHKERIVHQLRENGHVVGFMGDGMNDAPALRAADIGISVDSGVDIAKEAADIILLEKSLMVLEAGVIEGRKTFCNMLKYIRMTASSNFGNVFSILIASICLPFLPMMPLQLLVQNLLYDISQIAIPFDNVDKESVKKPLNWNPKGIGHFMVFFGPISSVFDVLTFALMWVVFSANTVEEQSLFQSGWFVVGLLTQTIIVHMIRTPKLPFIESRAAWPLIMMTCIIIVIGIALPMSPFAAYFGLQALPPAYFIWLVGIILGYAVLTTLMKKIYIRRFGWQ